jgi:hypothetical protein
MNSDRLLDDDLLFSRFNRTQVEAWRQFPLSQHQFLHGHAFGLDAVRACYQHLMNEKEPEIVVCEGASMFLPHWEEPQFVDHILYIAMNRVSLFRNIRLTLFDRLPLVDDVKNLRQILKAHKPLEIVMPFAKSEERKSVARSVVQELLG